MIKMKRIRKIIYLTVYLFYLKFNINTIYLLASIHGVILCNNKINLLQNSMSVNKILF